MTDVPRIDKKLTNFGQTSRAPPPDPSLRVVEARTAAPAPARARPVQPSTIVLPYLITGAGLVVVAVTLVVLMVVGTWAEVNPAQQFGEGFSGLVADEWQPRGLGPFWDEMKENGWAWKSFVLYPFAGVALVGLAGIAMAATGLLGLHGVGRSRSDVGLAVGLLLGSFLLAVGALRLIVHWFHVDVLNDGAGLRLGWLPWTLAIVGVVGSIAAAVYVWRSAAQPEARYPKVASLVAFGSIFLVVILPAVVFSTPDGSVFLHQPAVREVAGSVTDLGTAAVLYDAALVMLWVVALTNVGLVLQTTFAPGTTRPARSVRLLAHGFGGFAATTGLVLAIISFLVLPERPSLGYLAFIGHALLIALAVMPIVQESRQDAAAGPAPQVQT